MAKGMGNGFPVGGILINSKIKPSVGLLGTTYGKPSCLHCFNFSFGYFKKSKLTEKQAH